MNYTPKLHMTHEVDMTIGLEDLVEDLGFTLFVKCLALELYNE